MKRFFGRIEGNAGYIEEDELLHLVSVLRMKTGDKVIILTGDEFEYFCTIKEIKKHYCKCELVEKKLCLGLPKKEIILFQALTKREKMELIVQKAVELGITKLVPFESEYCVAKDSLGKKDRLEKIVKGACKQCERSVPMEIGDVVKFDEILPMLEDRISLFASERSGEAIDVKMLKNAQKSAIIIGPEGGFSEEEKNKIEKTSAISISLGKRILRSETAAVVLMGIVSVLGEN